MNLEPIALGDDGAVLDREHRFELAQHGQIGAFVDLGAVESGDGRRDEKRGEERWGETHRLLSVVVRSTDYRGENGMRQAFCGNAGKTASLTMASEST